MASLPIHWIEARAYCHATEDETRVVKAIEVACSGEALSREGLEGHFGNPIVRFRRRLERSEAIGNAWERWRQSGILTAISSDVDDRVDDDGVLHFRLDKQAAYQGSLTLTREGDAIDVRIKLKVYRSKPEEIRRVVRGLLEVP